MTSPQRLLLIFVLALLIPIIPFAIIGELPGEQWLSASDDNAFIFGISGAGLLASDVLLPIPSSIIGTLLGARLGFIPGWCWAWLGLVLGNLIGYGVGRLLPKRYATELPQAPTRWVLFISRPVPVLAEAVTFVCGANRMGLLPFLTISAAGNGIYAAILTANGASLLPGALIGPGLAIPMLLPVVAWLIWRKVRNQ